jgi:hypothetical protein
MSLTAMNAPSERRMSPRTKVALVLVLAIGVSGYSAIRQLVRSRKLASKQCAEELLLERYASLSNVLPTEATVGYLADGEGFVRLPKYPEARIGLLRYAVVPRLLEPPAEAQFIIFDSDRPSAQPDGPQFKSLVLVADFHDGLKVFRRQTVEGQ